MPAPQCSINGTTAPPAVTVAAGSTFTVALLSTAGANFWAITASATDELNVAAAVDATKAVNMGAKTATFVAPSGLGSAVVLTSQVGVEGLGIDANGVFQPSFTTTLKVNILTAAGLPVIAMDELLEQDAIFGWIVEQNQAIRAMGTSAPPAAVISANTTLAAPTVNTTYPIDTTSSTVSVTFTGASPAGVVATFVDITKMWATHAFQFIPASGEVVRNPAALSGADGSSVFLSLAGATASFKYFPLVGTGGTWI